MNHRWFLASAAILVLSACGDDAALEPTPQQTEAISTLIDTQLAIKEQRCMLEGLIETGIEAAAVIDGALNPDQDATLLAVAVGCVEDLTEIPGFVQSFIEGAAGEGTLLTETQARCIIGSIDDGDPTALVADCLAADAETGDEISGDDQLFDLLATACENGNNQACDELYAVAPLGSEHLELARTCAGRLTDSVGQRCYLDLDA